MLEKLRRHLFWMLDFLKGSHITSHYRDIKNLNGKVSIEELSKSNQKKIDKLLLHASGTVPYYKFIGDNLVSLDLFPIINKSIIRNNFEDFNSKKYINIHTHTVTTSGSTGHPFKIHQDLNKRNRNTADAIYFGEKAGFLIGNKMFYFRLWDKQYKKSKVLSWFQNIVMCSVDEMDDLKIKKIVEEVSKAKTKVGLLGYSSSFQTICKYLDKVAHKPILNKCTTIITIAETLNDYVKERLNYYFGIKAISRYSNSENGILAQYEDNESKYFKINWASYHIEILNFDSDKPSPLGVLGRIVITDLYNYAMPMIRYDTGDVGVMKKIKEKLVFTKIDGRKMDMFTNTKGEFISSHIVHKILQYDNISQFQFIQENDFIYRIKIKLLNEIKFDEESKVIKEYETYFGEEATVKIEYVSNIPALRSGKKKLVVNNVISNAS